MFNRKKGILHSSAAFTLPEILIVLFVFLMLISITIITLPKISEKREMELFLEQLSKDFHYVQAYAINTKTIAIFIIDIKNKKYFAMDGAYKENFILQRQIPNTIRISEGSLGKEIVISYFGHVSTFGTWYFNTTHYRYSFTIQIGRGRHYYAEL